MSTLDPLEETFRIQSHESDNDERQSDTLYECLADRKLMDRICLNTTMVE